MKTLIFWLNLLAAACGLVAAWLWYRSSKTNLPVRDPATQTFVDEKSREPRLLSMGDLGVTVVDGARISRRAAAWTAASTLAMAIATVLGAFSS